MDGPSGHAVQIQRGTTSLGHFTPHKLKMSCSKYMISMQVMRCLSLPRVAQGTTCKTSCDKPVVAAASAIPGILFLWAGTYVTEPKYQEGLATSPIVQ